MRSEESIKNRISWLKKAINDEDNDTTFMQVKLYAQLEILEWVLHECE